MFQVNSPADRRKHLAKQIDFPVLLWSGKPSPRNFPANVYPFRANSHFLYFAGTSIPNAAIRLEGEELTLFMDDPSPGSALWHGVEPTRAEWAEKIGADKHYAIAELPHYGKDAATLPVQDFATRSLQAEMCDRSLQSTLTGRDLDLARAVIDLRLHHDEAALSEMRQAMEVSIKAHQAGMQATPQAKSEAEVRAAIEATFITHQMSPAYCSIVTVHGEVLHNDRSPHPLNPGDLLLVDAGAETPGGWAADITRTWPVSGKFSPTQRAVYDVVLAAQKRCIDRIKPGVEYEEIHLEAALAIAEGLVDLGILIGKPESLVERDAHALFFPHGIGHLLGLDVHDMEDLGDLAGYAPGRKRSDRFGLGFLRLNRPLEAGMVVTVEPGFYQVPGILNDKELREKHAGAVNWDKLAQFADVRGIRIEDDLLVTNDGSEVLTARLASSPDAVEEQLHTSD